MEVKASLRSVHPDACSGPATPRPKCFLYSSPFFTPRSESIGAWGGGIIRPSVHRRAQPMKRPLRSCLPLLTFALLLGDAPAHAQNSPQITIDTASQVGTDDLGRRLPTYTEVGAPQANRWVGLFYWQW